MLTHGTKVLITGGAGFLGSHVARALSASGCEVRVLDDLSTGRKERIAALDGIQFLQADVRNPAAVHRAMHEVQAVIHLAGVQPGVDPIRAQEVNLGGALHILNFARDIDKRSRPRIVLCGSASVYGKQTGFVLHEELPPHPATPEAVMALAMEQYGRVYREAYGVPVVNLRIFRCFGPDEDTDRSDAGIVAKFVKAALEVADPPAEPLNIASGEAIAVNFLWNLVLETCGKKRLAIDPTYMPAPPWDPKHTRPQIARACKVLGWAPAVRLREGLARTVEFYQSQRSADPNAWFAPKEDATPKKKLSLPNVAVPTRRFGSVVTPAFGTPITNSSATKQLPRASSGNSFANALPRPVGSTASPLPRRTSSVVTPPPIPPAAKSVARPLPKPPLKKKEEVLEVSDADL
ncbi:MAG TPA: NAD-dependent epimerase/dehydratase family protein, partial [Polyangia bacterium]